MNTPTESTSPRANLHALPGGKKTEAQRHDESMSRLYSSMVFDEDGLCDFKASCKKYRRALNANIHWCTRFVGRLGQLCSALDRWKMPRAADWVGALITLIAGMTPHSGYPWYYDLKRGASELTMRHHLNSGLWKMHARLGFTMEETSGFISRHFLERYVPPVMPPDLQAIADMLCAKPKPSKLQKLAQLLKRFILF